MPAVVALTKLGCRYKIFRRAKIEFYPRGVRCNIAYIVIGFIIALIFGKAGETLAVSPLLSIRRGHRSDACKGLNIILSSNSSVGNGFI